MLCRLPKPKLRFRSPPVRFVHSKTCPTWKEARAARAHPPGKDTGAARAHISRKHARAARAHSPRGEPHHARGAQVLHGVRILLQVNFPRRSHNGSDRLLIPGESVTAHHWHGGVRAAHDRLPRETPHRETGIRVRRVHHLWGCIPLPGGRYRGAQHGRAAARGCWPGGRCGRPLCKNNGMIR